MPRILSTNTRYKKLYLKFASNLNIPNISHQGYFTDKENVLCKSSAYKLTSNKPKHSKWTKNQHCKTDINHEQYKTAFFLSFLYKYKLPIRNTRLQSVIFLSKINKTTFFKMLVHCEGVWFLNIYHTG